jgi:hypothetical protein
VELEPTIPVSERAKTVHALAHSATVTGQKLAYEGQNAALIQAAEMKFLRTSKKCDKIKEVHVPIWKELNIFYVILKHKLLRRKMIDLPEENKESKISNDIFCIGLHVYCVEESTV